MWSEKIFTPFLCCLNLVLFTFSPRSILVVGSTKKNFFYSKGLALKDGRKKSLLKWCCYLKCKENHCCVNIFLYHQSFILSCGFISWCFRPLKINILRNSIHEMKNCFKITRISCGNFYDINRLSGLMVRNDDGCFGDMSYFVIMFCFNFRDFFECLK